MSAEKEEKIVFRPLLNYYFFLFLGLKSLNEISRLERGVIVIFFESVFKGKNVAQL